MLSESATDVALALRKHIGSDKKGVGPEVTELLTLKEGKTGADWLSALEELEACGFIGIDRAIGNPVPSVPKELRGIVGVRVLEPLQEYFDQLGL